ncbi:MAG: hypothetical protein JXR69_06130 [Candidatus Delongbacteria bacterium]|nr:hypothetical protein [Candidatus Delongbacteria bacterium]
MNIFLKHIIFFSIGLLIFNSFVLLIVEPYYYKPYNNQYVNDSCKIILLADSHGLPLKDNLKMQGVLNYSSASDSYFDMYRKLLYSIKNSSIEKVIITTDNHTLSKYRENFNNSDRSVKYIQFNDYDLLITNSYELFKEKYLQRIVPLFNPKTTEIVKNYFKSFLENKNKAQTNWKLNNKKRQLSRERAELQYVGSDSSEKLTECVRSIIELCKDRKIDIVAIKFPLAKDYLNETYGKNYGADNIFKSLGIPVYDFRELYIDHDEYFSNQDHLNDKGGKLFSEELVKVLKL